MGVLWLWKVLENKRTSEGNLFSVVLTRGFCDAEESKNLGPSWTKFLKWLKYHSVISPRLTTYRNLLNCFMLLN